MTVQEFRNEFDLLYDNIASKGAPGLDDYEVSVFLTLAQEELVKNKNTPKSNKLQEGFEQSEKRRVELKELIRDYKVLNPILTGISTSITTNNISTKSKFYKIPNDVFLIKYESAFIDTENCNNLQVEVKPITLDEYNKQKKNPFKKPNNKIIWRLDYNSIEPGSNAVELISEYPIKEYNMRYLKQPSPIILVDLNTNEYLNEGLTILGQTQQQTSKLHPNFHSEIVRRAVELATLSYKENNLSNLVNLYQRKE